MSERVLHEWVEDGRWIRQISADGKNERIRKGGEDGSPWSIWRTFSIETEELARLAARVAELEGENAKLYSGILDLYNAHQNEKVNAEMRASGRWTQIKGLVGEANDRELRAARAEVDNGE